MKTKLLKRLRKNIRIINYSHGFYDFEMYYGFKWHIQGSYHYMTDLLKDIHYIINLRLMIYKKFIPK
jgi:hypothetical protein